MTLIDMNNQVTVSPKYDQIYNFLYNCISENSDPIENTTFQNIVAWLPSIRMIQVYDSYINLLITQSNGAVTTMMYWTGFSDKFRKQMIIWNDNSTEQQIPDDKSCVPELSSFITISTAHIKQSTQQFLDAECDAETTKTDLPVYEKKTMGKQHGWFIYINDILTVTRRILPDDLIECIDFANDYHASILCLDSNGPVMPQLIDYDKVRISDNTTLIKAVMQKGTAAIEDFIGHKLSGQESPCRIENQLKSALIRMSDDAVQIYRDKYFK